MFNEMIEYLKSMMRTPSADVLAFRELEEAKRRLLTAQSSREYADSMCKYHEAQVKRLSAYPQSTTEAK